MFIKNLLSFALALLSCPLCAGRMVIVHNKTSYTFEAGNQKIAPNQSATVELVPTPRGGFHNCQLTCKFIPAIEDALEEITFEANCAYHEATITETDIEDLTAEFIY